MLRKLCCTIIASSFMAILFGGCGDGLVRVSIQGVVTCAGQPVDSATVQLLPEGGTVGEGAIGQTDGQGKFTVISSRRSDAGVPPGSYVARVSRLVNVDGKALGDVPDADFPDAFESIPSPYCLTNSPLKVIISDKGGEVKIEIPGKLITKKK